MTEMMTTGNYADDDNVDPESDNVIDSDDGNVTEDNDNAVDCYDNIDKNISVFDDDDDDDGV